ncbi:Hypothetical predicted protein [Paramuricea clavata]|uniref:Uncharacterized protein n=1 Tax=Paramuricea clavata TaxID=317549 RepID=A0A7D9DJU5_PARCT|nr:Hypothetical predicted protein [Paramuricea clavata]
MNKKIKKIKKINENDTGASILNKKINEHYAGASILNLMQGRYHFWVKMTQPPTTQVAMWETMVRCTEAGRCSFELAQADEFMRDKFPFSLNESFSHFREDIFYQDGQRKSEEALFYAEAAQNNTSVSEASKDRKDKQDQLRLLNQDPPRPPSEEAVQHEQCFVNSNQEQPEQTSTTHHPKPSGNSYFVLPTLSKPQSGKPVDSIKVPFQIDSAASCNTLPVKHLIDIPWANFEPSNVVLQPYAKPFIHPIGQIKLKATRSSYVKFPHLPNHKHCPISTLKC